MNIQVHYSKQNQQNVDFKKTYIVLQHITVEPLLSEIVGNMRYISDMRVFWIRQVDIICPFLAEEYMLFSASFSLSVDLDSYYIM